jgi:hypothetical protein
MPHLDAESMRKMHVRMSEKGIKPSDMRHTGRLTIAEMASFSPEEAFDAVAQKIWDKRAFMAWWMAACEGKRAIRQQAVSVIPLLVDIGVPQDVAEKIAYNMRPSVIPLLTHLQNNAITLSFWLSQAFAWERTQEGHGYWKAFYDTLKTKEKAQS